MTGVDISGLTALWVWYLGNPRTPEKVGTVSLIPGGRRCSFIYDDTWETRGFPLSPDMPFGGGVIMPSADRELPGALEDAMPDRWGQGVIRAVYRPRRLTSLDFLYYAGDRRFGALGVSTRPDKYLPCPEEPLLTMESLEQANNLIQRILNREPLDERERRMLESGRSMGGARPKMLIAADGEEWIVKFPGDGNVDLPLVEHASMVLARGIGIDAVESRAYPMGCEHVVATKRFDRVGNRRLHCLSAKTMLHDEGGESYAAIANIVRKHGVASTIQAQRRELFARMAFNILMDNTDDHAKNHAFIRRDDGHYDLAPAYDIPPQLSGIGRQAIPIAAAETDFDRGAAVGNAANFGLSQGQASELWQRVADGVSCWESVFREIGVIGSDIEYLSDVIDDARKRALRRTDVGGLSASEADDDPFGMK